MTSHLSLPTRDQIVVFTWAPLKWTLALLLAKVKESLVEVKVAGKWETGLRL